MRLIGSLEEMQAVEDAWRELESSSRSATIFQTFDFCRLWWQHLGTGRLHILTLLDNEGLLGIAPLYKTVGPLSRLRFLGTGIADYLGFLAKPELAEFVRERFVSAIRESLGLLTPAADLTQMPNRPPASDGSVCFQCEVCPRLRLPDTYEEFLGRLGKKTRFNLGYYKRRMERDGHLAIRRSTPETLSADLAELFRLHKLRWRGRGLPGVLGSNKVQGFHQAFSQSALNAHRLSLFVMELDGKTLAAMLCYDFGGARTYYIGGFDPAEGERSPGKVLMAEAIRDAIERKMMFFDFARGDEDYKRLFKPELRENYRLFIGKYPWAAPLRLRLACERSLISVGRKALKWRFEKGTA